MKKANEVKNMEELRQRVCKVIADVENGTTDDGKVEKIFHGANVTIKSVMSQIAYARGRKESPDIRFLDCH